HESEQHLERLLLQAVCRLHPSHVVDHHGNGQFHEKVLEFHQIVGIEMKNQMPAQRTHSVGRFLEERQIGPAAEVFHKIESHAAGPKTWQCASQASGGSRNFGLRVSGSGAAVDFTLFLYCIDPMKLGMFMMPLHPPQRKPAETYAEDRGAVLLADRLGYCEALVG